MASEWLKVMLEEVARKRDELERALAEEELRKRERPAQDGAPRTRRRSGASRP
jgi:hypothetical protein